MRIHLLFALEIQYNMLQHINTEKMETLNIYSRLKCIQDWQLMYGGEVF